jgi:hypothetical protein
LNFLFKVLISDDFLALKAIMLILRLLKFAFAHSNVIQVPVVSILAILTLIVEPISFVLKSVTLILKLK